MLGLASLLLGVVAVFGATFPGVGLPAALASVSLGALAHLRAVRRRRGSAGLAMAGWMCGLFALAAVVVFSFARNPVMPR